MTPKFAFCAALLVLALVTPSFLAMANPNDFEFHLVEQRIKLGDDASVLVRLTDKRTGNPVAGAVIFATRMDMEPDGMESMTTPVEALPSAEPGTYKFKTSLAMEGNWRLSIAAKIQGEMGTVESRLILEVVQ